MPTADDRARDYMNKLMEKAKKNAGSAAPGYVQPNYKIVQGRWVDEGTQYNNPKLPSSNKQDWYFQTHLGQATGQNFGGSNFLSPPPPQQFVEQAMVPDVGIPPPTDSIEDWRATAYRSQFVNGKTGFWVPNNQAINHNGEALPEGALGWDWYGNPYFGDGVIGKGKEIKSKYSLAKPVIDDPNKDWSDTTARGPLYRFFMALPMSWQYARTALESDDPVNSFIDQYKQAMANQEQERFAVMGTAENIASGEAGPLLAYPARVIGGIGSVGMYGIQGPASETEKILGAIILPQAFPNIAPTNGLMEIIDQLSIDDPRQSNIKTNYQAGRILYSSVIVPASYEEFVRRYRAGENPYLLKMELENPIAEAVGQSVLDPLNLVGMGYKNIRTASRIDNSFDELLKAPTLVDEALKSGGLTDAITAHIDEVNKTKLGVEDLSKSYTLTQLTPGGKQAVLSRRANEVIAAAVRSSDDPLEAIRALILGASDDPNDVANMFSFAKNQPQPSLYMSRAARETGTALRNMLMNEDGVIDSARFLEDLKEAKGKGLEAVLKFAADKMESASQELFPTVLEREKALKLLAENKEIPDSLRTAARQARDFRVNPVVRRLAKIDKVTQSYFYGPANRFFASVYMGLSPAYALRNMMNNTTQTIIDMGLGAVKGYSTNHLVDNTKAMLGGVMPSTGKGGFGSRAALTGQEAASYYTNPLEAIAKGQFRGLAEYFEQWGGLQVVNKAVTDTMTTGVMKAKNGFIPPPGMDQKIFDDAIGMLIRNKFDVDSTVTQLLMRGEDTVMGMVDAFREANWLTSQDVSDLVSLKMTDEFMDIIKSGDSPEVMARRVDDLFAERAALAKKADNELAVITDEVLSTPQGESAATFQEAARANEVADGVADNYSHYINANHAANQSYSNALSHSLREALNKTMDNPELRQAVMRLQEDLSDFIRGDDMVSYGVQHARYRNTTVTLRDASYKAGFDVEGAVNKIQEQFNFQFAGKPITPKEFRQAMWEQFYFPNVRKTWEDYREAHALAIEDGFAALSSVLPMEVTEYNNAREILGKARQWDGYLRDDQIRLMLKAALDRGDNAGAARAYAQEFGIYTALPDGTPLDKRLLNIINSGLIEGEEKFEKLSDVPAITSRDAIIKYLGDKFVNDIPMIAPQSPFLTQTEEFRRALGAWEAMPMERMTERMRRAYLESLNGLYQEILSAERKGFSTNYDIGSGIGETTFWKSTFPEWYDELTRSKDKKRVLLAIDKLEAGKDSVLGAQIKSMAVSAMLDEKNNPLVMVDMGFERAAKEAIDYQLLEGQGFDVFSYAKTDVERQKILDLINANLEDLQLAPNQADITRMTQAYIPARPTTIHSSDAMPQFNRMLAETQVGAEEVAARLKEKITANYGATRQVIKEGAETKAVKDWGKYMKKEVEYWRTISQGVANQARDFTLLNYQNKRYFDLALAYVFPYQFWYSRTYKNWLARLASDPGVVAGYLRYKDAMAKIHADLPDFYKYQINVGELLGIDPKIPLFFNLEATINPLNGITGVDFNDPDKRVNWWTSAIDDIQKFGPSMFTPFQYVVAAALGMQGEKDAALRWAGRLIPQTTQIKSALTLMGANTGLRSLVGGGPGYNEFDPIIAGFHGGLDPYERRRVGRSAAELIAEGENEADVIDQITNQEGPYWEEAARRSLRQRAWSNISAWMFGVGFKARSQTDVEIDKFDQQRRRLVGLRSTIDPETYRLMWKGLNEQYPFADLVILSRLSGAARDEAYTYNILARIPPAFKDDMARAVGFSPDLISKFYDNKGDMSQWNEFDRDNFLIGIAQLGGLLDLPDQATAQEWEIARNGYNAIYEQAKTMWGKDIWDKVDLYYTADPRARADMLEKYPEISQVQDWREGLLMSDPTLAQYYMGIDKVTRYFRNRMYEQIRTEFGADIWDKWDKYFELQLVGAKEAKAYYDAHPELKAYGARKEVYEKIIASMTVSAGEALKAPNFPGIRIPSEAEMSIGQRQAAQTIEQGFAPVQLGWDDFRQEMSPTLQRLVLDYIMNGEELSYAAQTQLDRVASEFDTETYLMMEMIARSLSRRVPLP